MSLRLPGSQCEPARNRAYETLRAAVDDGRLRLLFTHVNIDELAVVSDIDRRSRLLLAIVDLAELVATGACVANSSRG